MRRTAADAGIPAVYEMNPKWGSGSCRIYPFGGHAALILTDFHFARDYRYAITDSSWRYVSYYFSLDATYRCSNQRLTLQSEMLYSNLATDMPHETIFHQGCHASALILVLSPADYYDYLRTRLQTELPDLAGLTTGLNELRYLPELNIIARQLRDYTGSGLAAELYAESKFNEVISIIFQRLQDAAAADAPRFTNDDRLHIDLVAEYLRTHLAENTELSTLSGIAYMSPAKLKYTFRSIMGLSVSEYRLQQRIALAKELLQNTGLTIGEIAGRVGYDKPSSFSAQFRRQTGMLPRDWRRHAGIMRD